MAQIISIKMSKFDNQPWGFRLQGGTDFAAPLTVLRVHGDSLAEKAGLRVGDALIRVNDTDIYQLRHKEAQDVIVRAGNNFELVISRGGGMPKTVVRPNDIQVVGPTIAPAPVPVPASAPAPTPVATVEQKADGGNVKLVNRQFNSPMPLYSEENIAETLSSQAEVLAQGVLGVNFKKNEKTFNPANSEVFKMVQDMDRAPREPEPERAPHFAPLAAPHLKPQSPGAFPGKPASLTSAPVKPVSFAPAAPRPAAPSPDGSTKVTWPPAGEQAEEGLAPSASLSAPEEPVPVVEPPAPVDVPQPVSVVEPPAPIVAEPAPAPAPAPSPTPVATPAPTVVPVSSVIGYHDEMSQHQQTSANAGFLTGIPAASAAPPAGGKGNGGATNSGPRRGKGIMNHHVAGTRIPVCATCNAQIRGKFVTALGLTWCPEHFLCSMEQCRHELHDTGFVEEQGKLYCETCFENYLAPSCARCSKRVKAECLNAIGKQFHPECFACTYCGRLFGNSHFYLEDGLPYCEADWNELFTTKCFACGFPIEAGDRWVEAMNNNYHSQCFNCSVCKKNLEGQSFLGKGGRPMCKSHVR